MGFLVNKDYDQFIRKEIRGIVMQNNSFTLEDAELTAISIINSYLSGSFDTVQIFKDILTFSPSESYNADEYVYAPDEIIYKVLVNNPGQDFSDPSKFTPQDPRNRQIVMYAVDITLYNLHSNSSPQNIPDLRVKRYDDAIKALTMMMNGQLNPDLPRLPDGNSGTFRLGSNPKVSERY